MISSFALWITAATLGGDEAAVIGRREDLGVSRATDLRRGADQSAG
jgi:hypothetical protein